MKLAFKLYLLFFIFCSLQSFGSENGAYQNKIPIDKESIRFEDGKIYIQDEWGSLFSYPMVCFTQEGAYLPLAARRKERRTIWICENCTTEHQRKPTSCVNCGHDKFLVRYK